MNNPSNLYSSNSYLDERGSIFMVLESCSVGSVSRITSVPDSVRARHYHVKDSHFILVNYGEIEYYEVPFDGAKPFGRLKKAILKEGDIYFTPPLMIHEMNFNVATQFDCYSLLPRGSKNYESDTVRVNLNLKELYNKFN